VIVTDGGPDHRLTFVSVKFSYLALFLYLNLDMLVAVRTCPYQSWSNLAERVMSTLNLSLQNVSLSRNRMEEAESIVKGKKTMVEVRKVVEKNPNLGKQLQESLSQPKDTHSSCFASRMNQFKSSMVPLKLTFKQCLSSCTILIQIYKWAT